LNYHDRIVKTIEGKPYTRMVWRRAFPLKNVHEGQRVHLPGPSEYVVVHCTILRVWLKRLAV
jgi:hypothetical protein